MIVKDNQYEVELLNDKLVFSTYQLKYNSITKSFNSVVNSRTFDIKYVKYYKSRSDYIDNLISDLDNYTICNVSNNLKLLLLKWISNIKLGD